jgi:2-(1,2-epoxy-1,2-dihydrophenyl)acetyl-CoA isomerase
MSEVRARAEHGGQVQVIEINRPQSRNSLSLSMLGSLRDLLTAAGEQAGAVVLHGCGGAFCSGVDGREVRDALTDGWGGRFGQLVSASHDALLALLNCPVPVLAAVDGPAAGAGVTYAMLADTRVVTAEARLRPGHLAAGAPLDGGSSVALAWLLGPARAMSLLLENRAITGTDLHHWGLAAAPVAPAELENSALDLAQRAAGYDRAAVLAARTLLRRTGMPDFEDQWTAEVEQLRAAVESGRLKASFDRLWGAAPPDGPGNN